MSFQPTPPTSAALTAESLQREGSAQLMGQLPLGQGAVLEGAVARRSNSGPLSRTMLRVRPSKVQTTP